MTDFKAPPPPPQDFVSNSEVPPVPPEMENVGTEPVQEQTEPDVPQQGNIVQQNLSNLEEKGSELRDKFMALPESKKLALVAICMLFMGMLLGSILFGGDEPPPPAPQGLIGVIANPDVKKGVKRCGTQESSTRACVLYIMNNYHSDKVGGDFFETAVKLTGRSDFKLRSDNMHYKTTRIPPGHFAQIYIPSVD